MARLGGDKSNYVLQVYVSGQWQDVGLTSTALMNGANVDGEFDNLFPRFGDFGYKDDSKQNFITKLSVTNTDGSSKDVYFMDEATVIDLARTNSPFQVSVDTSNSLLTITYTTPPTA